jgi:hypothetical protein
MPAISASVRVPLPSKPEIRLLRPLPRRLEVDEEEEDEDDDDEPARPPRRSRMSVEALVEGAQSKIRAVRLAKIFFIFKNVISA